MKKKKLLSLLKLLRPKQWIKNFAVFSAIVFNGELFDPDPLRKVLIAFFVFCALSSAIYVINDFFDIEKDRLHPFKKFRPLANKDISVPLALSLAAILIIASFAVGFYVTPMFFFLIIFYAILQFSYSLFLKHIAVADILIIASGYILRVYAGEFASGFHISVWLLLTVISLSLFLAVGKRRCELTLLSGSTSSAIKATRKSLSHYSERLLDVYASMFATSTFISYSLFTFLENSVNVKISSIFLPDFLPTFFQR
ncbi:MAG: decaprenyl-phosphate phosphoribosyltransferase, partial [bacterium]|nr:decaprenyl-phosphate phosphoribosyltransferase [bacterium]